MAVGDEAELAALRARAYGRGADIHSDPAALARLQELEDRADARSATSGPVAAGGTDRPADAARPTLTDRADLRGLAEAAAAEAAAPESADPQHGPPPVEDDRLSGPLARRLRALPSPRRSTVILVVAAALVVTVVVAALVLVQRVQTDPIAPGARQVARLGPDRSYSAPSGVAGPAVKGVFGYRAFHGMRPIVTAAPTTDGTGAIGSCLGVFSEEALSDGDLDQYTGPYSGTCGLGAFPPHAVFSLNESGIPADLRAAYPDAGAIDFVYDKEHREVVVFVDG